MFINKRSESTEAINEKKIDQEKFYYLIKGIIVLLLLFQTLIFILSSNGTKQSLNENFTSRWLEENKFNKTEFNIYFDSFATVIKSKVPLNQQYLTISWPAFNSTTPILDMDAVFITSGRAELLSKTLQSFFVYNTYPIRKIIVIHDGKLYNQLNKLIQSYQNITWIITNNKVGQVEAVDQAFRHIQTDYYFFSEDDFQYFRHGFIQFSLQSLLYDPKLNGVVMAGLLRRSKFQYIFQGPVIVPTFKSNPLYYAFSYWPSAKRMKQYRKLEGGYTGACFNKSYGKGVGSCEAFYSFIYTIKDYYLSYSPVAFYSHFEKNSSPVKFWLAKNQVTQEWRNIQKQFNSLQIFKLTSQQQKLKFQYLAPNKKKQDLNLANMTSILQSQIKINNQIFLGLKKQSQQSLKLIQQLLKKQYSLKDQRVDYNLNESQQFPIEVKSLNSLNQKNNQINFDLLECLKIFALVIIELFIFALIFLSLYKYWQKKRKVIDLVNQNPKI